MAVGNGGIRPRKEKISMQDGLVSLFQAAFWRTVTLGWYMVPKWYLWELNPKFGTLREVRAPCGQTRS